MTEQAIDWNEANVALLKRMWADGHPHSQIAARIPYATRSAIAGKIMRLRLPPPDRKNASTARRQHVPAPRPTRIAPPSQKLGETFSKRPQNGGLSAVNAVRRVERLENSPGLPPEQLKGEAPDGTGIKFAGLTPFNCHWPKGDPLEDDFEFCGAKALPDLPYCAHHSRIAYAPPKVRDRQDKWALSGADLKS